MCRQSDFSQYDPSPKVRRVLGAWSRETSNSGPWQHLRGSVEDPHWGLQCKKKASGFLFFFYTNKFLLSTYYMPNTIELRIH